MGTFMSVQEMKVCKKAIWWRQTFQIENTDQNHEPPVFVSLFIQVKQSSKQGRGAVVSCMSAMPVHAISSP